LKKHDKEFEWVLNEWEGHGFRKPDNVRDLYLRMEAFLAKHTAPRTGAAVADTR
jgi:dipeptidyl aminopeptidase/acylaminoacyl peptidase